MWGLMPPTPPSIPNQHTHNKTNHQSGTKAPSFAGGHPLQPPSVGRKSALLRRGTPPATPMSRVQKHPPSQGNTPCNPHQSGAKAPSFVGAKMPPHPQTMWRAMVQLVSCVTWLLGCNVSFGFGVLCHHSTSYHSSWHGAFVRASSSALRNWLRCSDCAPTNETHLQRP